MTNKTKIAPAPTVQALSCLSIFGPPPLLPGEDAASYDDLLARVSGNLKPSDIFEEIWTREIVDLIWETARWRRNLAAFIATVIPKVLERMLKPLAQNQPKPASHGGGILAKLHAAQASLNGGQNLATDWAAGDPAAKEHVNQLLASAGLTMESVVAQALASELDKIERFNRLIASAEARCNALLHEVERHRATFAQKLRGELHKIEDAEFQTIKANSIAPT